MSKISSCWVRFLVLFNSFIYSSVLFSNNPRLWRDLAYIMSKLTYNERALKGLLDHYNYYADKLVEDVVYESFLLIISNARKSLGAKPDLKVRKRNLNFFLLCW